MSLRLVHLASRIEKSDDFHMARLLVLMHAFAGRSNKPVQGIMKLAKMDFLLRYPNCLARVLEKQGQADEAAKIPPEQRNTIEARMIRFRYGPWDDRYRRWIALLAAKGLVLTFLEGRTVYIQLTEGGKALSETLAGTEGFIELAQRSKSVKKAVGPMNGTALKDHIYEALPEIVDMKWGHSINL
jgi:hypothetical protein